MTSSTETKHTEDVARLIGPMRRYRSLATAMVRPALLAIVAMLLILVILPAALAVQAGAIP